jgi:hypothetical protein
MAYWIKKAVANGKGKLRAKAKASGGITKKGTISKVWLKNRAHKAGILGKEARLAMTLGALRH